MNGREHAAFPLPVKWPRGISNRLDRPVRAGCRWATRLGLVIVMAMTIGASSAWAVDGWYAAVGAGKAWFEDKNFVSGLSGATVTEQYTGEWEASAAAGYAFRRFPLRLEAEFTYLQGNIAKLQTTSSANQSGSDRHYVGMANLYYDLSLGERWRRWKPYVGAGLGFDRNTWKLAYATLTTPPDLIHGIDSRWFFAYQVKAGVAYSLTETWDLVVGYRYFRTEDREFTSTASGVTLAHDAAAIHALEVGVRWDF